MPVARGLRPIPDAEASAQHQAYERLGVTAVDTDAYVVQAFHAALEFRQVDGPKLLDALHAVGSSRQSVDIQVAEASIRSEVGLYSETDLNEAYQAIGLKPAERGFVMESDIVDAFNRALDRPGIGDVRRRQIFDACDLIARHEDSPLLTGILSSRREPAVTEPTLDEAYRAFGLASESHGLDDELLLAMYQPALDEAGSSGDKVKKAMAVIARERKSAVLKRFIASGAKRASADTGTR